MANSNSQQSRKGESGRQSKSPAERAPANPERRLETEPTTLAPDPKINELQQLVHEKNELLEVLTERLEMAAEQLDRVRRQGGPLEQAPAPQSGGGFEDPALTDDLRQMLADWQDLRGRGYFGALEERLDGIQGMVSQLRFEPSRAREEDHRPKSVAEILANHGYEGAPDEKIPNAVAANLTGTGNPVNLDALELPESPPSVDIENGSTQELRDALRQREEYIVRLKDYLIAIDSANELPIVRPDLAALSAEQQQAMENWEASVRKEVRQTQIQLWIERAQLSREQMRISQMEHHLETETRRIGMAKQRGASATTPDPTPPDAQKGKNWLGLFGNNK